MALSFTGKKRIRKSFGKIAEAYLSRVPAPENVERSIDAGGDLLTRRKGKLDVEKR